MALTFLHTYRYLLTGLLMDAMEPGLYKQFKNAMEIAYKDTRKE